MASPRVTSDWRISRLLILQEPAISVGGLFNMCGLKQSSAEGGKKTMGPRRQGPATACASQVSRVTIGMAGGPAAAGTDAGCQWKADVKE